MKTEEILSIIFPLMTGIIIAVILYKAYQDGAIEGLLKFSGIVAVLSSLGFLIYYIVTYISNENNSPLYRSFFSMGIVIIVSIIVLIINAIDLKPYIDGLLTFMGINNLSQTYFSKGMVIFIGLLLATIVYLTSDLNFDISKSSGLELSFPITLFSGITLLLIILSSLGMFSLNMINPTVKLLLFPLLVGISLFSLFDTLKSPSAYSNGREISFILSIATFLLYILSLYFVNSDSLQSFKGGLAIAFIVMLFPILNHFILQFTEFNKYLLYIFSGVVALIGFLLLSGKLINKSSFHNMDDIKTALRMDDSFSYNFIFYIILLILIPIVGVRFLSFEKDEAKITDDFEILKNVSLYIFPIVLIMLTGTNIFDSNNSGMVVLLYSLLTMGLLFGYLYLLTILSDTQKDLLNYISGLLMVLILVLFLSLIFLMTGNYMASLGGFPGVIAYLIFYIPCLIIDFINYIKKEFSLITPTIGIVFILEIIVILCYLYLPKLFNQMTKLSGVDLVKEPIILNEEVTLPAGQMFLIPPKEGNKDEQLLIGINNDERPRYNYAMSMWVYINTNEKNSNAYANEVNILNYDNKPSISYKLNISGCKYKATQMASNGNGDVVDKYLHNTVDGCKSEDVNIDNIEGRTSNFIFRFTNEKDTNDEINTVKIELPSQKWHFFVFNYNDNIADLFVNGNLYNSYKFTDNNRPTYDKLNDTLTIGQEKGLEGVICNTVYHTKPLTKFEIVNTYNLLMNYNPPINNL